MNKLELPRVFGVCGLKRHGKDTFGKYLSGFGGLSLLHFADPLKDICREVFGLSVAQVHGDQKEIPFHTPISIDDYLQALSNHVGFRVLGRNITVATPRALLQHVGTEYIRSMEPDYWVRRTLDTVKSLKGYCVVADVRFPNEVAAIKAVGGLIIRVIRKSKTSVIDQHESEMLADSLESDLDVGFPEGRFDLMQAVANGMARSCWEVC